MDEVARGFVLFPETLAKSEDDLHHVTDFELLQRLLFFAKGRLESDSRRRFPYADGNGDDGGACTKNFAALRAHPDIAPFPAHLGDLASQAESGTLRIDSGAQPLKHSIVAVGDPILLRFFFLLFVRCAQGR